MAAPVACASLPPTKRGREAPFDGTARAARYAEKLDPQPQVLVALGFLMTNCAPSRPSV
jgi:hypothetical protein